MKKFVATILVLGSMLATSQSASASESTDLSIGEGVVFKLDKEEISVFIKTVEKSGSEVSGKIIGCSQGLEYAINRNNVKTAATCVVKTKSGALKIANFCSNEMVGEVESKAVDLMRDASSSLLKFASENCGG